MLILNPIDFQQVTIGKGQTVKIRYKGYLNQESDVKGQLVSFTDSSLRIAVRPLLRRKEIEILFRDMTGLRKYSTARLLAEASVKLLLIVGTITLSGALPTVASIPYWVSSLTGTGFGLAGVLVTPRLFSDKIQFTLNQNWKFVKVN